MKAFNTTGVCIPSKHYMVDISARVLEIRKLVDAGKYFTINRARQYGKTTTLTALKNVLSDDYLVLSLDFQGIANDAFATEAFFSQAMARLIMDLHEFEHFPLPANTLDAFQQLSASESKHVKLDELFRIFKRWIKDAPQPVVLMVDEVDSATNNQVFLDFLAQLRNGYISRDTGGVPAFHSVILAGVADVKHLKRKLRDDDRAKVNSPWNIAADFGIDMSLSADGICGMLEEYESDHHTGMDTAGVANLIHDYTSGYPFLVSRLCQLIDTDVKKTAGSLSAAWTKSGTDEAVRLILAENNTLFQSVTTKLENYPDLKHAIRDVLMEGTVITYNTDSPSIAELQMYGFIKNNRQRVAVSNRIFETRLYNLFLSEEEMKNNAFSKEGSQSGNIFVTDGRLNVRLILERFISTYHQVCGPLKEKFDEKDGRELFLLYLKPIINGTGNYYIEAQTRDSRRTDVIIDYHGEQFIIELKIWRGERYNAEGERQIIDYLDYFNLNTGYMLSFNFNQKKETGVKRVCIGDKVLYEGTV